ncbi:LysR family transcriptional regulator [Pseudomonas paraeruginosa]
MSGHLDKLSWGDLRIVTAIGEGGSLVASAATLGLNHSTVSRRLAALEAGPRCGPLRVPLPPPARLHRGPRTALRLVRPARR